jgi:hypothetical protein
VEHLQRLPAIAGPIVADHFETFVGEQENALGILTAVDSSSGYTYLLEPAWHRRATARSRRSQRQRVAATRGAYRNSIRRMLKRLMTRRPRSVALNIVTDDHHAFRHVLATAPRGANVRHRAHRNPPDRGRGAVRSPASRARDRALSSVDALHRWIRHVDAGHRRESIAFCRRGEALLERLAAVVIARNLIQRVSERRNDERTPAVRVGLTSRPWTWGEVLSQRRWPTRMTLDESTRAVLDRSMQDPRGMTWPRHVRRRSL